MNLTCLPSLISLPTEFLSWSLLQLLEGQHDKNHEIPCFFFKFLILTCAIILYAYYFGISLPTMILCEISWCISYQHAGNCNSDSDSLKPALVSVSCLLVVVSLLTFIIGFICGHCFSQRRHRKLTQHDPSMALSVSTAAASEHVEDLELNENVAYVTTRPK